LDQLLAKWETESRNTKLMACDFTRWHYDSRLAPAGIHATWARGIIRYAAPDKGEFRVDELQFYKGMNGDKPQFAPDPKQQGEHWVCNGTELLEFDRAEEVCNIQVLPEEMRGQKIFQSPLPFVFNLDAKEVQRRYWVRELAPPANKQGTYLIEAWPKSQEDRSQYRFVQISIDAKTFLPQALILYAPNFDPQTSPTFDHYEFSSVTRNGFVSNVQQFINNFIDVKPPKNWKVIREPFGGAQQAAVPTEQAPLR
jgi:TIGR03009 family protein